MTDERRGSGAQTAAFRVAFEVAIDAAPGEVFRLLSDPAQVGRWLPMTTFGRRVGDPVQMEAGAHVAVGEITVLEPPHRIGYSWDWRDAPIGARTEVLFEVEPRGGGSVVRVTHVGFPSDEAARSHEQGWRHYAARLREAAEGRDPGPDTLGTGA